MEHEEKNNENSNQGGGQVKQQQHTQEYSSQCRRKEEGRDGEDNDDDKQNSKKPAAVTRMLDQDSINNGDDDDDDDYADSDISAAIMATEELASGDSGESPILPAEWQQTPPYEPRKGEPVFFSLGRNHKGPGPEAPIFEGNNTRSRINNSNSNSNISSHPRREELYQHYVHGNSHFYYHVDNNTSPVFLQQRPSNPHDREAWLSLPADGVSPGIIQGPAVAAATKETRVAHHLVTMTRMPSYPAAAATRESPTKRKFDLNHEEEEEGSLEKRLLHMAGAPSILHQEPQKYAPAYYNNNEAQHHPAGSHVSFLVNQSTNKLPVLRRRESTFAASGAARNCSRRELVVTRRAEPPPPFKNKFNHVSQLPLVARRRQENEQNASIRMSADNVKQEETNAELLQGLSMQLFAAEQRLLIMENKNRRLKQRLVQLEQDHRVREQHEQKHQHGRAASSSKHSSSLFF